MNTQSLPKLAHQLLSEAIHAGDVVVDATAGNGHDTLFLAANVGEVGQVFAFDIQADAIHASRERLHQHQCLQHVCLYQASHSQMTPHIPLKFHAQVKAVVFNLGYLPGGDKSIITSAETTLLALSQAARILCSGGVISLLVYPGHTGGDTEHLQIQHWLQALNPAEFTVTRHDCHAISPTAPVLYWLEKHAN